MSTGESQNEDKDLEDFLQRKSELSRHYQSAMAAEPPADIDQAVLAQARAAVAAAPGSVSRLPVRSRSRWMVPFALAASVVLSFAIFREAGVNSGVATQDAIAPATAPMFVEESESVATSESNDPAQATFSVPAQESKAAEDQRGRHAEVAQSDAASKAVAPPTAPMADASVAKAVTAAAAEAPAANAVAAAAPALQRTAERARAERDVGRERTSEAWLQEIRELRAKGEPAQADAELRLFRDANPDYFERNPGVAIP